MEQFEEEVDLTPIHDTFEHLQMYKEYCKNEIEAGREIPTFTEFRTLMNE